MNTRISNFSLGDIEGGIAAEGEVTLWPSDRDQLEYLGGGTVNRISDDGSSLYAALPRPARLPAPPFNLKKVKNKGALSAFLQLWNGKFHAEWTLNDTYQTVGIICRPIADASVPDTFSGNLITLILTPIDGRSALMREMTKLNEGFSALFKEENKTELGYRVFYHFLRAQGAVLMRHSPELLDQACAFAKQVCSKDVDLLLDIAILNCDLVINHQQNHMSIGRKQVGVAEALEGQGRFADAAVLYQHVGEKYYTESASLITHAMTQEYAALAFKRDGQLEKAEKMYVRALHFRRRSAGSNWNLNDMFMTNLLTNIVVLYMQLQRKKRGTGPIELIFYALLYVAGFQAGNGGYSEQMVKETGRDGVKFLKPEYRRQAKAMEALVEATATPDISKFHLVVKGCKLDNLNISITVTTNMSDEERRRIDLEGAQDTIGLNTARIEEIHRCGYRPCSSSHTNVSALKSCPCKTKSYCQKSCQVADWPVHKKVCPWQAKRMQKQAVSKGVDVD